jgi:uncharacterized protein (DUF488 family)
MTTTLYTIGHSNRSLNELLAILAEFGIRCLVDVRTQPASTRHPQFNEASLRAALTDQGLHYHWAGRQLGGFRAPQPNSQHVALAPDQFRGFADYMESAAFAKAAMQLIHLAQTSATAILCAEKLPEHCHRSLIADYLTLKGVEVVHLLDRGDARAHLRHPAVRTESGQLVYDRGGQAPLALH